LEQQATVSPIRDTGPYSSRNSSKGALIEEAGLVVGALALGLSVDEVRDRALNGVLFEQRSRNNRERIWDSLHHRYLTHRLEWVLASLEEAYARGPHSQEFVSFLYLHYALRDSLTFDFITQSLWERWTNDRLSVSREDVLYRMDKTPESQPNVRRWKEGTRVKLATSTLTALRDFGVLKGKKKKVLLRPVLPLFTAEHLLRLLTAEGIGGLDILLDVSWRLFFYTEEDVADTLHKLAQERRIQFERAGSTVVLNTPIEWSTSI